MMTAQQLKNSILQRAIEGKLVEQRPEEGTAKDLLKEIKLEKEKLVKEGKIQKSKPLPAISEDEIPFEIPESWEWVRLGEIFNMQAGKNISAASISHSRSDEHPFQCYGGNGVRGYVSDYNRDGVYPLIGRQGALCGNVHLAQGKFYATEHAVVTELFANTNPIWAKYFLVALNLNQYATATAQPGLAVSKIENVLLPLPPLSEQHRIVAKIEELLPLVDQYDKAYSQLTALNEKFPQDMKKSILQYAIEGKLVEQRPEEGTAKELLKEIKLEKEKLVKEGKIKKSKPLPAITEDEIPFEIPDSWEWVRLGNIGDWGSGATPKRHHPEYYGGNIPWLKTGDLNDGIIERIPESITQEGFDNSSVRLNPVGSVLMAMYGATIGKLGILNIPATTNQACCACILFAGLSPKYLFYHLMSQRKNFIKLGEGGAQPNISKEKIVNYLIPLPPLSEQHRIVERLEQLLPLCDKLMMEQ